MTRTALFLVVAALSACSTGTPSDAPVTLPGDGAMADAPEQVEAEAEVEVEPPAPSDLDMALDALGELAHEVVRSNIRGALDALSTRHDCPPMSVVAVTVDVRRTTRLISNGFYEGYVVTSGAVSHIEGPVDVKRTSEGSARFESELADAGTTEVSGVMRVVRSEWDEIGVIDAYTLHADGESGQLVGVYTELEDGRTLWIAERSRCAEATE